MHEFKGLQRLKMPKTFDFYSYLAKTHFASNF